nr:MAG TPA: hypothetical protein [Caudoviricetes sp.]
MSSCCLHFSTHCVYCQIISLKFINDFFIYFFL